MAEIVKWEDLGTPPAPEPAVPVTPPGSDPAAPNVVTFDALGTPPEGYKPPGFMEDAPKAILSGAEQGGMGLAGMPGAIHYYADKAEKGIRSLVQGEQAALDWERNKQEGLSREDRQSIAEGKATAFKTPWGTKPLPTMTGMDDWGRANLPNYDYEPSTKGGEMLQSGANFGVQSLVGGPKGMLRRFATGVGAGAGANVAGDVGNALGGNFGKVAGEIGGAVFADILAHKVIDFGSNMMLTNREAYAKLGDAISADMAADPAMAEKLRTAMKNGEPIYVADLMQGKAAQKLLADGFTGKQQFAMRKINQILENRASSIDNAVDQKFAGLFGRNLRDDNFATAVQEANKLERGRLYTGLKALPQAQSVISPSLISMYRGNGFIRDAMDSVSKKYRDGYIDPSFGVQIPAGGMAPNLQYWDLVKREIDDVIEANGPSGTGPNKSKNLYNGAVKAKEALTGELDTLVPEYASVRNQAAEMFGVENSLEGGYKMAQQLAGGSPFKTGEFMQKFRKLSADQQEAFAEGAARSMMQKAKGDMGGLISYMENPNVKRTMSAVMGADRFDALYSKAVTSNLMANASKFELVQQGGKRNLAQLAVEMGGGAAGGAGIGAVSAAATSGNVMGLATLGAAATGALAGLALNSSERKVADRVVQLAFSPDPKDAMRFRKLLADNYDAVSVVRKLSDTMSSAAQKGMIAFLDSQRDGGDEYGMQAPVYQPPMNAGGRVARKSGGRITSNPISSEVKKVRALLSQKTASMLSMPDDAVATALHIAKGK